MGGKSEYVANAGGISQKVKEILAQWKIEMIQIVCSIYYSL